MTLFDSTPLTGFVVEKAKNVLVKHGLKRGEAALLIALCAIGIALRSKKKDTVIKALMVAAGCCFHAARG